MWDCARACDAHVTHRRPAQGRARHRRRATGGRALARAGQWPAARRRGASRALPICAPEQRRAQALFLCDVLPSKSPLLPASRPRHGCGLSLSLRAAPRPADGLSYVGRGQLSPLPTRHLWPFSVYHLTGTQSILSNNPPPIDTSIIYKFSRELLIPLSIEQHHKSTQYGERGGETAPTALGSTRASRRG